MKQKKARLKTSRPRSGGALSWSAFLRNLPVIVCALIAGAQIFVAQTSELSPWKGGGFGMFSTGDDPSSRSVHIVLETGEVGLCRIQEVTGFEDELLLLRTSPSRGRALLVAGDLLDSRWELVARGAGRKPSCEGDPDRRVKRALPDGGARPGASPVSVVAVEVTVVRRVFRPTEVGIAGEALLTVRHEL